MTTTHQHQEGRATLKIEVDEILGYVQPWILSPGDEAAVKVRALQTPRDFMSI